MNKPSRQMEFLVWGGLVFIIALIAGAFAWTKLSSARPLPVIGQISNFTLTNQDNQPVTLADMRGKVWVADVIFTRCAGPCPEMTHQMAGLQSNLPPDQPVRLVTFTSDPDYDTPAVMRRYASRFNASFNLWYFLTGPRKELRNLEINDFKFVVVEKKPGEQETPEDLFIHSTWFVLVDQLGRVRGWTDAQGSLHAYFDSLDPGDRAELLRAIRQLLREPAKT